MDRQSKNDATLRSGDSIDDTPDTIETGDYVGTKYVPGEGMMQEIFAAQENPDTEQINRYECESCGTVEELTEAVAYESGWDYPPFIGIWGILSPRTCPNCTIETTAYWAVLTGQGLSEKHQRTIERILGERIVVPE